MDPKTKTPVTHSRGSCICDHCGKKMNRHNLKKHTQDIHPGQQVKERMVGVMSLTQFVHRLSSPSKNNTEQSDDKDHQETRDLVSLLEPEVPEENAELTLKDLNEHISNNHKEVMQELANIKNKCSSGDKANTSEYTFKKPMENHEHYLLEKAKTFKECVAACPEFVFVKELKTIYCTICITKEEFEKLNDYNLKPGVINFLGDPDEEKDEENDDANDASTERVKIPKIISNLKKKM